MKRDKIDSVMLVILSSIIVVLTVLRLWLDVSEIQPFAIMLLIPIGIGFYYAFRGGDDECDERVEDEG